LADVGAVVHLASRSLEPGRDGSTTRWRADLSEPDAARRLLNDAAPDLIFHLAGHASAAPALDQVQHTLHKDLVTAVNVLCAAAETRGCRVILTGSLTEPFGGGPEEAPGSPYAAAKWATTAYGRMFHALYQLPVVIVRPFMSYGPGQATSKLIPHVTLALLRGESPPLASGRQAFDWIYVDDVVAGFIAAGATAGVEGATLDLGTGILTTVREVVERLVRLTGAPATPAFGRVPDRPLEHPRRANVEATRARLGWVARVPLEDGLARTVAWCRDALAQP
jgi:UDP-glucose 4-epimerase